MSSKISSTKQNIIGAILPDIHLRDLKIREQ